jgi:hypothetical protein
MRIEFGNEGVDASLFGHTELDSCAIGDTKRTPLTPRAKDVGRRVLTRQRDPQSGACLHTSANEKTGDEIDFE